MSAHPAYDELLQALEVIYLEAYKAVQQQKPLPEAVLAIEQQAQFSLALAKYHRGQP